MTKKITAVSLGMFIFSALILPVSVSAKIPAAPALKTSSTAALVLVKNPLSVTTGMVYNIKSSGATLSGNWNDETAGTSTWFEYGTKMDLGKSTSKTAQKSKNGLALGNISGLSSNTTYYFKAVAQNSAGKVESLMYSFRTLSGSGMTDVINNILVATNTASNISRSGATLNAFIDLKGDAGSYWFEWGDNLNLITNATPAVKLKANNPSLVNTTVVDLNPGTTYYFRAVGQSNAYGIARGEVFRLDTSGKSYLAVGQTASALNAELTAKNSIIWLIGLILFYFLSSFALHRFLA